MTQTPPIDDAKASKNLPLAIYILYLASFLAGLTGIVGVVLAYVNRGSGPAWLDTHYTYQIRTFWIGLVYTVIGFVTMIFLVGWLVLPRRLGLADPALRQGHLLARSQRAGARPLHLGRLGRVLRRGSPSRAPRRRRRTARRAPLRPGHDGADSGRRERMPSSLRRPARPGCPRRDRAALS